MERSKRRRGIGEVKRERGGGGIGVARTRKRWEKKRLFVRIMLCDQMLLVGFSIRDVETLTRHKAKKEKQGERV